MAIYKRDIASINLETGTIHRTFLNHSIGYKDQKADHFGIRVFRDGEPVDLTGVSVQGVFMPPQGDPIAITSGNIVSGNEAEVVLPQACYNYDGQFCLAIKLVDSNNSVTGTMRIVDGMVDNTHASGTVAPTSAVPTYQEILSTYDAMVAATAAANGAIAATYSSSSTYKVGDYCIHDGGLYRCTTAITTAEAWTSGHWTAAKIGPDVSDLKSAMNGVKDGEKDGYRHVSLWTNGTISTESESPTLNTNNKRVRPIDFIYVKAGDKVKIDNGTHYVHVWWRWVGEYGSASDLTKTSSWQTTDETVDIIEDGFIMVAFADSTSQSTVLDPSAFDGSVEITSYAMRKIGKVDIDQFDQITTPHFDSMDTKDMRFNHFSSKYDFAVTDDSGNVLFGLKNGSLIVKEIEQMKLSGKKVSIIGDSISTYNGYIPSGYRYYYPRGDIQNVNDTWWMSLINETGLVLLKDAAWSGSGVTGNSEGAASAACSTQRVSDLADGDTKPDIILIYISTNDWAGSTIEVPDSREIGSFDSRSEIPAEGTITNISDAYALMLYKIRTTYPQARVYCITNIEGRQTEDQTYPIENDHNQTIHQVNHAITEIAHIFGATVVDLETCGIHYWNVSSYTVDGTLHPNKAGAALIKEAVKAKLFETYN